MKVLVIGKGGREHALAHAVSRSPLVDKLYAAPGNPGMAQIAENVNISDSDVEGLVRFAKEQQIDLTIVGPEHTLALGVADAFAKEGLRIFGPSQAAAQVESSKEFAKKIMMKYDIPTAAYESFTDREAAIAYVKEQGAPIVIKEDGLKAGKGVTVAQTLEEAIEALTAAFAQDGGKVVIEECLSGFEFSLICLVCGEIVVPLEIAQDHKRAFDGDQGPNTGGMGAYSPLPQLQPDIVRTMKAEVVTPTIEGLVAEGFDYHGILYIGAVLTRDGAKVIEYNVRLGDPETQVILPRIETDLVDLFAAAINGTALPSVTVKPDAYLGITLAADGYPQSPVHGQTLPAFPQEADITLDYANVAGQPGALTGAGGRLVTVIGHGPDVVTAQKRAYAYLNKLTCPQCFYRKDIGFRATGKTME